MINRLHLYSWLGLANERGSPGGGGGSNGGGTGGDGGENGSGDYSRAQHLLSTYYRSAVNHIVPPLSLLSLFPFLPSFPSSISTYY